MTRTNVTQAHNSLAIISIFAGLSHDALERIQQSCAWRHYDPGAQIVDYQDVSDDVFFIISGEARATIYSHTGKVVSFSVMGPGEVFGEYPAIDRGPRSASVEARTRCLIASTSAAAFRKLLHTEPRVVDALLRELVARIRVLTTRVYQFSTLLVNNRIQAELLRLADLGATDGNVARIDPAPTHVEIASRVSTHREAVTRELSRLARIGVIERRGGVLVVKDLARLSTMVHEAAGE